MLRTFQMTLVHIVCKIIIHVYLLRDVLGQGGEHTFIRIKNEDPRVSIYVTMLQILSFAQTGSHNAILMFLPLFEGLL